MNHYEINKIINNSVFNENTIKEYCLNDSQNRIYSHWERIEGVHRLLMMLGFTLKFCEGTNNRTGYFVKHWYGNDNDSKKAIDLINSLEGE